ncbi:hypothetical protein MLD38_006091 [Melastoma candidum]|uniref:Uncharacterized protein n=1 Tax=Melastoma candidum TaxID=119954 RepID=A0ACB9RL72_9MYRT|nr:hypothetical protein MLD38_006091 [Melastoma candidum]
MVAKIALGLLRRAGVPVTFSKMHVIKPTTVVNVIAVLRVGDCSTMIASMMHSWGQVIMRVWLSVPEGIFGLGFKSSRSMDGSFMGFGHSGMGSSTGFVDVKNQYTMAVTLNKTSMGTVTRNIIQLVCSELGIPISTGHMAEAVGESSIEKPMIN